MKTHLVKRYIIINHQHINNDVIDELVPLPEVELDLSLLDDDHSTQEQSIETKEIHSEEASPQLPSADDVEYAGTKEQGTCTKCFESLMTDVFYV